MRSPVDIARGTKGYPDAVARRLRIMNVTAYCGAILALVFAAYDLMQPKLWTLAAMNAGFAVFLVCIPALHRFGEIVAPLTYISGIFLYVFVVCMMLGTDSGMQLQFAAIAAGSVLVVGADRVWLLGAIGTTAIAFMVLLEISAPHDSGLLTRREMMENYVACVVGTCAILFSVVAYAVRGMERAERLARSERERSDALLGNILPENVITRLKSGPGIIADRYDEASVLLADMAGFTATASHTSPAALVSFLNEIFSKFDGLVARHGLEKIKTSGDSYLVVSGVPVPRADHAEALARFALDLRDAAGDLRDPLGRPVPIRIGMASGPVVAGIIGTRKFFYDVWGDAVNLASRMETTGVEGAIQVTGELARRLAGSFCLKDRGDVPIKGKGVMRAALLLKAIEVHSGLSPIGPQ